ncbi:hypothetical protein [Bacillus marinisedimentorum]|uniref:hypothetical protein n=1 Tax=Bacillus marinisedimentorum TaxID=1821260 RepID=UPI001FDFC7A6|nr:hypothetical protein [Bacillus marinisedimentorum]
MSEIDFTYFIGQKVIKINSVDGMLNGLLFESAVLTIECPWRLRTSKEIIIGYSDCIHAPDRYSSKNVEKVLTGTEIAAIYHFENTSDLIIEFKEKLYLDLFHDSSYFEGWQLQADNGFHIVSLPGGSGSIFRSESSGDR